MHEIERRIEDWIETKMTEMNLLKVYYLPCQSDKLDWKRQQHFNFIKKHAMI